MLLTILNFFSYISTVIFIIVLVKGVSLWLKGIIPVLLRLGNGLAKSKIAIFAKDDNLTTLENLLLDSGLFSSKNILRIRDNLHIYRAENASLYLVFWHDWQNDIDKILTQKRDGIPLIVYAPQELGFIPQDRMVQLGKQPNTIVTNFPGRLLNDIMISLITGSYGK